MHPSTSHAQPQKPEHARHARHASGGAPGTRRLALASVVGFVVAVAVAALAVWPQARSGHATAKEPPATTAPPSTTDVPSTVAPTTDVPSTVAPTTDVPSTVAPTTVVPTTAPRSTTHPVTASPPPTAPPQPVTSVPAAPASCTPTTVPGGAYAVGDSVMIDAQQPLQECVPNIQINAAVSRQWSDGETILRQVMAGPAPPAVVVVDLGTNGPITAGDVDSMMSILQRAVRVVFVTVHVGRPWQDQVNAVLSSGVARNPGAVLANWQSLAAQHPEWFYSDGTHLPIGGVGAQALAGAIAAKV
jgi:cytoskeletal protein RodZ